MSVCHVSSWRDSSAWLTQKVLEVQRPGVFCVSAEEVGDILQSPFVGMNMSVYGICLVVSWHDRTSDYRFVLSPGVCEPPYVYPICFGGDHGFYQNLFSSPTFWIVSHDGGEVLVQIPVIGC